MFSSPWNEETQEERRSLGNQQREGSRRAVGMNFAMLAQDVGPDEISGCDEEVVKTRWGVWGRQHHPVTWERGIPFLTFWCYVLKSFYFFSASTLEFLLLWKISLIKIMKLVRHTFPILMAGTQTIACFRTHRLAQVTGNIWVMEGVSALIRNTEVSWSHPWFWHQTTLGQVSAPLWHSGKLLNPLSQLLHP